MDTKHFLACDIGNTTIALSYFYEDKVICSLTLLNKGIKNLDDLTTKLEAFKNDNDLANIKFTSSLIASVVPLLSDFVKVAIKHVFDIEPLIYSHKMKTNISVIVDNPNEVGADLICDIVGAISKYKVPCLIVDYGTITKCLLVDENKTCIGASFFPGVGSCLSLMGDVAALLPNIEKLTKPSKIAGNNTVEAMVSGVYYSSLGAAKEWGTMFEKQINKPVNKIVTGGYARLFIDDLNDFIYDEHLVLNGILALAKLN